MSVVIKDFSFFFLLLSCLIENSFEIINMFIYLNSFVFLLTLLDYEKKNGRNFETKNAEVVGTVPFDRAP